ncbi:DUF6302 family protein [Streptomyces sp. NPDC054933]
MTPPTPLTVRLLPPAEACDYEYFRDRLADPSVLENSVAVCLNRAPLLAVAVGGPRRGGYLSVDLLLQALAIRRLLMGRPGYHDVRVRWSPYRDTCHVVEWGDTPPRDDVSLGRFYGYSDTAITAFLQERTP